MRAVITARDLGSGSRPGYWHPNLPGMASFLVLQNRFLQKRGGSYESMPGRKVIFQSVMYDDFIEGKHW